jgi:hypothetical protein
VIDSLVRAYDVVTKPDGRSRVRACSVVRRAATAYRECSFPMRAHPSAPSRSIAGRIVAHEMLVHEQAERAALTMLFNRLSRVVGTLVGSMGCKAVFARGLRLAAATHPSLVVAPATDVDAHMIAELVCAGVDGGGRPAPALLATEVLAHVLDLLAGFIGKDLTFRIVRREWADVLADIS